MMSTTRNRINLLLTGWHFVVKDFDRHQLPKKQDNPIGISGRSLDEQYDRFENLSLASRAVTINESSCYGKNSSQTVLL